MTTTETTMAKTKPDAILGKPGWWVLFVAATLLLSQFFRQFKVFTITPTWTTGGVLLGVIALLIAVMAILLYDSYVSEKRRQKIQHPMALFDWLDERRFLQSQSKGAPRP